MNVIQSIVNFYDDALIYFPNGLLLFLFIVFSLLLVILIKVGLGFILLIREELKAIKSKSKKKRKVPFRKIRAIYRITVSRIHSGEKWIAKQEKRLKKEIFIDEK